MFPLIGIEQSLIYLFIDGVYIDSFEINELDDCINRIKDMENVDVCFFEDEDFYMSLILGRKLNNKSIEYQIISRSLFELYYLIYNGWSSNDLEIVDVGEKEIWAFLDFKENYLKISFYSIENCKDKMNIEALYESVYLIFENKNPYFQYLEIRDRIKDSYVQNISSLYILNKVYISGDLLSADLTNILYKKMNQINISPKNNLMAQIKIYYSYKKGVIKDPFVKKELKYLRDSIYLNQYWNGKDLSKTTKIYNKNDRLNSKISIEISPLHSTDKILKYGLLYQGKEYYFNLEFPFIYYSSILNFEFIAFESKLKVSVKLDDLLIYNQVIILEGEEDRYEI